MYPRCTLVSPGKHLGEPRFLPATRCFQCTPRLGTTEMSLYTHSGSLAVSSFCRWLKICGIVQFQSTVSSVPPSDPNSYPVLRQVGVGGNLLLIFRDEGTDHSKIPRLVIPPKLHSSVKAESELGLVLLAPCSVHFPLRDWSVQIFQTFFQLQFQGNLRVSPKPFSKELM